MMPKRYHQKCLDGLLVTLLAIHFLFAHTGLPGYVLCIGSDGHVTIESSREQGDCDDRDPDPVSTQSVSISPVANVAVAHCGPCVDVTLHADCNDEAPTLQKKFSTQTLTSLQNASYSTLTGFAENRIQNAAVDFQAVHNIALSSLHTIVLLI